MSNPQTKKTQRSDHNWIPQTFVPNIEKFVLMAPIEKEIISLES